MIGVDEKKGIPGVQREEFTNWWQSMHSQFESAIAPIPEMLVIPFDTKSVVAILFGTDRAPFLVKNPKYGNAGESVEWEVPWREGTKTRTSTRADLLKLLVPLRHTPRIDVLGSALRAETEDGDSETVMRLKAQIFVEQESDRSIFFTHRCSGTIEGAHHSKVPLERMTIKVVDPGPERGTFSNKFIACFSDPGVLEVDAFTSPGAQRILDSDSIQATLTLATHSPLPVRAEFTLHRAPRIFEEHPAEWRFGVLVPSE
jgi:hypothetical protein